MARLEWPCRRLGEGSEAARKVFSLKSGALDGLGIALASITILFRFSPFHVDWTSLAQSKLCLLLHSHASLSSPPPIFPCPKKIKSSAKSVTFWNILKHSAKASTPRADFCSHLTCIFPDAPLDHSPWVHLPPALTQKARHPRTFSGRVPRPCPEASAPPGHWSGSL